MKRRYVIHVKQSKKGQVKYMGRYDGDTKKKNKRQTLMIFGLLLFLIGVAFVLFSGDEESEMCDEIIDLMLNDPSHSTLHDRYPNILMNLHVYLDKNCETVDENNPMGINP
jgi:hypothetical protein